MNSEIRVLLVDNHPIVRAGIRVELEKMPDVVVVGEAGDGRGAMDMVKAKHPHVVFMDITMPGLNGLEATERITKAFPEVRVVILSRHEEEDYFWDALKRGASGYLLKKAAIAELRDAVHRVASGEIYLTREISNRLVKRLPVQQLAYQNRPLDQLTTRQREILQLIAEGQTTKSIGHILRVSPKTVEYHRGQLMSRLRIHDIPGLVRFALRQRIISADT